jgi:DDE family transposase
VRLAALIACGTRAVLAAAFGSTSIDERDHAAGLLGALHPGMLVLADRNFGYRPMLCAFAGTGADLLVRIKAGRRLPVCRRCGDGSWLSRIGPLEVRVLRAQITIATATGRRSELYQLVTTVTEPGCAAELIRLYHQRWEIETAYAELKHSILGGRVLRARTPAGIEQEIYALLVPTRRCASRSAMPRSPGPTWTPTAAASPWPCTRPATSSPPPAESSPTPRSIWSASSAARSSIICCPTGAAAPLPGWSSEPSPNTPHTPPAAAFPAPATRPQSASTSSATPTLDTQARRLTERHCG